MRLKKGDMLKKGDIIHYKNGYVMVANNLAGEILEDIFSFHIGSIDYVERTKKESHVPRND